MKKTDRRTLYTKMVIQEAFLNLKGVKAYNDISVTDICRKAEISRGTFYLHYNNISEVLDEVLDAAFEKVSGLMEQLGGQKDKCRMPLCEFIREESKYRCIFLDESLSGIVIKKMSSVFSDEFTEQMELITSLSKQEIEDLTYFQLNGCLAVCRRGINLDGKQWCAVRGLLDRFIKGGLTEFYD